jgi:hypothetical protein
MAAKFGEDAEKAAAEAFGLTAPRGLENASVGKGTVNVGVARAPDGELKVTLQIEQGDQGFTTGFDPEFAGTQLAADLLVSSILALGPENADRLWTAFSNAIAKRMAEIQAGEEIKRGE